MEGTLRGSIADVLEGQISGSLELLAGEPVLENLSVSSNGVYEPQTGVDGFDKVTVNVPTEEPKLETLNVTQNGTYTPGSGVDGFDEVNVNVQTTQPVLDSIEINENGHFTPPAGTDGYDDITVYVPYVTQGTIINENGTYTPPSGVDGFGRVIVDVPTPPPSLQSLTVSHNGYFLPSSGYDGFDEVTVDVATPLETLSATENGTYTPSSGYEGFSEVTVDVPLPNNAYLLESQKDDVVTIQNGAEFDMPKLIVSIEPQQSGSGDPSPENVRPISGWTACNVVRTGKNLFDVANTATIYSKLKQGQTIYAKQNSSNDFGLYVLYEGNSQSTALQLNSNTKASIVLTKDVVQIAISDNARNALISQGKDIMVSTTDFTDIEPYNGNTYTINFVDGSNPLTVYGGTLDVLTGVLTVKSNRYNLGDLNWAYSSAQKVFYCNLPTDALNVTNKNEICEGYKPTSWETMDSATWTHLSNGEFVFSANLMTSGRCALVIKDLNYTDTETFKGAVDDIYILYPLATPQTYQLTPTEVKSLLGVNSIYADTGEVDVQVWTKDI